MSFVTMSVAAMVGTGAAIGAGTGAIGSVITGGDPLKGALIGAGTGGLTAGLGSVFAAPAAVGGSAALNPVLSATGATLNPATSLVAGTAAAVPSAAAPVGTAVVAPVGTAAVAPIGTAAVAPATTGGLASLPAAQQAAIAGGSRFAVGSAAGQDAEEAGLGALTAAGGSAVFSGLGELAANPGVQPGAPVMSYNLGGDAPLSTPGGVEFTGLPDVTAGAPVSSSNLGKGFPPLNTPPGVEFDPAVPTDVGLNPSGGTLTDAGTKYGIEQSTGPQAAMNLNSQVINPPTTSVSEGLGNLADQFSTTDKAIDSARSLAPQTALTAGGLYAQKQLRLEDEEAAEEEKRRRGYSQSIWNNYMSQGRMPHPSSSLYKYGFANGGIIGLTNGLGDGTSDSIPAVVDGGHPAKLSSNEFVIPADVVSHIGNGSTEAGAQSLYDMMDRLRVARTNSPQQPNDINPRKYLPA